MLVLIPALMAAQAPLPADVWHQIGPNPRPFEAAPLPIPRRKRATEVPPPMPGATPPATQTGIPATPVQNSAPRMTRYTLCLAAGEKDPAAGIAAARAWLAEAAKADTPNTAHGAAAQCLGQLLLQQGDSTGAEAAFIESAGQVPATDPAAAAALQVMAGNAALAGGRAETALGCYDKALAPPPAAAPSAEDNAVRGAVQIGRARALVALGRLPEASGALQEAHRLAPNDPEGWLLSATLARRGKDLERAQRDIEVAASLAGHGDPLGAPIGLEAGVIAMLSGREDAARKSWESVVALAPGSTEAVTAKGYLDQIGPAPTSGSAAPAAPGAPPPETSR
ncbi:tetratricopeptide repeat protein [Novosphingobium sp.]|uniref:tetratricopeptide repeat protein n=1 Tax=Novosphingobium sp. TaxID=1874826 RepID=UPI0026244E66|nr:tetratricopeptide repeat protein [Novosphingobium sp.]